MKLQSGDIFATRNDNVVGWLARMVFSPYTDRFHFGIVWQKAGNDWVVLESIGKGIAVGRLSFYRGKDMKFYRVNCPYGLRRMAGGALTRFGRSRYDYWLIFKILGGATIAFFRILFKECKVRKLKAEDLCPVYSWDSKLICTEAAWAAYSLQGVDIIPYGTPPLPSSFRQAELEDRIYEIT